MATQAEKDAAKAAKLAAAENQPPAEDKKIEVSESALSEILKKVASLEMQVASSDARSAGLEEILNSRATEEGGKKLREKKTFEPTFNTVRIRQFPMGGDHTNLGYVVGWTNRGAYQEVDRSGVSPQYVDYIDVIFLDHERNEEGKLKAEKIKVMDLMTKGVQVNCKIQNIKRDEVKIPTGEEIDVTVYSPAHGLISTGDTVDGFWVRSEIEYTIEIPGRLEPVKIDGTYVN